MKFRLLLLLLSIAVLCIQPAQAETVRNKASCKMYVENAKNRHVYFNCKANGFGQMTVKIVYFWRGSKLVAGRRALNFPVTGGSNSFVINAQLPADVTDWEVEVFGTDPNLVDRLLVDLQTNPGRYVQFSMFGKKDKSEKKDKKKEE